MTKPADNGGQAYDRSVDNLAAKLSQKGADRGLRHALTKQVQERAEEIADFIINRAHDKSAPSGK